MVNDFTRQPIDNAAGGRETSSHNCLGATVCQIWKYACLIFYPTYATELQALDNHVKREERQMTKKKNNARSITKARHEMRYK